MMGQLPIALAGGVGLALAAGAAYVDLGHQKRWARVLLRAVLLVTLGVNLAFIAGGVHRQGVSETLRQSFEAALLLATLIGLAGLGTHFAARLRGLDGFLLVLAAAVQFGSLTVIARPDMTVTDRPWFVSHGLAFALGGTCFTAGGAAGIAYLLVRRMLRRKPVSRLMGRVASLEALERFGRWMPIIGLPLFTYGILTGLCGVWHREDIGRTAWYLDLSFVASLVVWLLYAYLSYCVMYKPRFRGRRSATLAACGLGLVVIAFVFQAFLSPMHHS